MTPEHLPFISSRQLIDGVSLEVAEAGPPDGPLIVFLHGFPDLWQGWHLQLPSFLDAGFRVIAPNQRGYGDSDKPIGLAAYDLDLLAGDIIALVDRAGRSTFNLVGHDWGGIIAWWVAARFPERVERMAVLSAPHPGVFKTYLRRSPTQLLRSWYVGFFQLPGLPEWLLSANDFALLFGSVQGTSLPNVFDQSDRKYLRSGWSQRGALTAMLNYYRALARRSARSLQLRIKTPTLALFGRRDPAEEPGLIRASARLCDDCRFIELAEARHWIQREESARVNAELLSFLTA